MERSSTQRLAEHINGVAWGLGALLMLFAVTMAVMSMVGLAYMIFAS